MPWINFFGKKKEEANAVQRPADAANMKVVVRTDLGNIRTNNEDAGLFLRIADAGITLEKGCILMVADGMGGHQAGEVASKMATDIISTEYFKSVHGSIEKTLAKVFTLANKNILAAAAADTSKKGMGTTCTALIVTGKQVYYAHVGDSRAYVIKKNIIGRITTDHTYVQELIKAGTITAAEAAKHPQRNILTNAMGTKPQIRVDTGKCDFLFEENDRLIICSDGLYDYLEDVEIAGIVNDKPVEEGAEKLVAEAKRRGGHDNITVILAEKTSVAAVTPVKETGDFALPVLPVTKEIDLP
ncbi:MAG: Stp1/IreP family PP2C-type Ser/Thr phosphatase [Bacteroidota bacterium]